MRFLFVLGSFLILASCINTPEQIKDNSSQDLMNSNQIDLTAAYKHRTLNNPSAFIPSQCYTKTINSKGNVHNPCYTCHTNSQRPNYIDDVDLQLGYDFAEDARTNPWNNLFKDRSDKVASITNEQIEEYIQQSNYFDDSGNIILQSRIKNIPKTWDFNGNGQWDGFVPDLWYNFDEEGFDHDHSGQYSGWRSFAYYPFPGTFWPANGSTDDVIIRLPESMRQDSKGQFNLDIYKVNLAIVEAMLREESIAIDPVDESRLGSIDIDKDGTIGIANQVTYDWAPREKRFMWYVGKANQLQKNNQIHLAAGLYPEGTEFIHTVRYIDFDDNDEVTLSNRIKELRYARKYAGLNYSRLRDLADGEFKEKHDFPNRLKVVQGNHEVGVSNGQGWIYSAFIEDTKGELRPQTYEELVFCAGCHGGIGANRDGIFSFHRRLGKDEFQQGWYHWSQKSIKGLEDPYRKDGHREYTLYLQTNKAGDEFRANIEIMSRFFNSSGELENEMLASMQQDISQLLWPSMERAMELNKAYKVIVDEQSFIYGRDATIAPPENVHRKIKESQETGVTEPVLISRIVQ
ncbi:MAG: hypothetical protein B6D77_03615 [gamma proteobacterium symbiont of Ctena orbiculata]|nr:MAG: hypothetical protein B6D77_03615 [gamma proteobacterium symbiont of Ctena orbiculata]